MSIASLRRDPPPLEHVSRGRVLAIREDGLVQVETASGEVLDCEVLLSLGGPPPLHVGDRVLVLRPEAPEEHGCILGVVGSMRDRPETVRLDAGEELHLVCGESSIRIRADGRVVIRGEDVASLARGVHRIKGGTVEIN